jgi:hypothetical protein
VRLTSSTNDDITLSMIIALGPTTWLSLVERCCPAFFEGNSEVLTLWAAGVATETLVSNLQDITKV